MFFTRASKFLTNYKLALSSQFNLLIPTEDLHYCTYFVAVQRYFLQDLYIWFFFFQSFNIHIFLKVNQSLISFTFHITLPSFVIILIFFCWLQQLPIVLEDGGTTQTRQVNSWSDFSLCKCVLKILNISKNFWFPVEFNNTYIHIHIHMMLLTTKML